jgi:hypothetical protein
MPLIFLRIKGIAARCLEAAHAALAYVTRRETRSGRGERYRNECDAEHH